LVGVCMQVPKPVRGELVKRRIKSDSPESERDAASAMSFASPNPIGGGVLG